jgi:hypothetical protein
MRELARRGRITNEHVVRHCYPPVARVRRFLAALGWDADAGDGSGARVALSSEIYDFLAEHLGPERARFDYAFDLPILAITRADRYGDLRQVLGRGLAVEASLAEDETEQGLW